LYEDAGDHYGYKDGQSNTIRFKQVSDGLQFRLKKKFFGQYHANYKKHRVLVHGLPFLPTEYVVDGKIFRLNARNFAVGVVKVVVERKFEELIIR
jgi:alpha-glucosidase